jgi:hypothetical protein
MGILFAAARSLVFSTKALSKIRAAFRISLVHLLCALGGRDVDHPLNSQQARS